MPYITQTRRNELAAGDVAKTYGELNYLATRILLDELGPRESWSYAKLNRMVGIIESLRMMITRGTCAERNSVEDLRIMVRIMDVFLPMQTPAQGQNVSDLLGVLECVKLEFYRRVVVPYEDAKITENGDAY